MILKALIGLVLATAPTAQCPRVDVTWGLSSQATGYVVYRADVTRPVSGKTLSWHKVATLPATELEYMDMGVTTDIVYFYRVEAVGSDGKEYVIQANAVLHSCSEK